MGQETSYRFSYRAKDALVKRAKEITPQTIEMLLRCAPSSFNIINCIWHVFPGDIMDRLVLLEYWDTPSCNGQIPLFMKDHILKNGEKLLEKFEKSNMILANILSRRPDETYGTSGILRMEEADKQTSPMTSPETYLKYYKRYRRMPKMWRDGYNYGSKVIENMGDYILAGKLNIVPNEKKEVKADETGDNTARI
jgi:hypothetical protein